MQSDLLSGVEKERSPPQQTPVRIANVVSQKESIFDHPSVLRIVPEELFFYDVRPQQFDIKSGNAEVYSVEPSHVTLAVGASVEVRVQLKVKQTPRNKKRDIFHIRSSLFDQKFFATLTDRSKSPQSRPRVTFNPNQPARQQSLPANYTELASIQAIAHDSSRHIASAEDSNSVQRLKIELDEKNELLSLSHERIASLMKRLADSSPNALRDQTAETNQLATRLENAEKDLKLTLRQLEEARLQIAYLSRIEDLVRDTVPSIPALVDAVVGKEREEAELKNKQILDMFSAKDQHISRLEQETTLQRHVIEDLQQQLLDAHILMDNIQSRSEQVLQERKHTLIQFDETQNKLLSFEETARNKQAFYDAKIKELQDQLETSSKSYAQLYESHNHLASQLEQKTRDLESMSFDLKSKTKRISELEKRELHMYQMIDQQILKENGTKPPQAGDEKAKILEETISSQSIQIERLTKELSEFRTQIKGHEEARTDKIATELTSLREENELLKSLIEDQSKEIEELLTKTRSIQQSGSDSSVRQLSLQIEGSIESIREQLEAKYRDVADLQILRKDCVQLSNANQQLVQKSESLVAQVKDLEHTVQSLRHQVRQHIDAAEKSKRSLSETKSQLESKTEDNKKLHQQMDELRSVISKLRAEIKVLQESEEGAWKIANARSHTVSQARQSHSDFIPSPRQLSNEALAFTVKQQEQTIKDMQERLDLQQKSRVAAEKSLESIVHQKDQEIKTLEAKLSQKRDDSKSKLMQLEATVHKLSQKGEIHKEVARLGAEVAKYKVRERHLQSQLSQLEDKLKSQQDHTPQGFGALSSMQMTDDSMLNSIRHDQVHSLIDAEHMTKGHAESYADFSHNASATADSAREAQVELLKQEILQLHAEIRKALEKIKAMEQSTITEKHAAGARAIESVRTYLEELSRLQFEHDRVSNEVHEANKHLAQSRDQISSLQQEISRLNAVCKQVAEMARKENAKIETELSDCRAETNRLQEEKQDLLATVDERRVQISILMETIQTLHNSQNPKDEMLAKLSAQMCAAKSVEKLLERRIAKLHSSHQDMNKELRSFKEKNALLENDLGLARAQMASFQETIALQKKEILSLRHSVDEKTSLLSETQRSIALDQEKFKRLESTTTLLRRQLGDAKENHFQQIMQEREANQQTLQKLNQQLIEHSYSTSELSDEGYETQRNLHDSIQRVLEEYDKVQDPKASIHELMVCLIDANRSVAKAHALNYVLEQNSIIIEKKASEYEKQISQLIQDIEEAKMETSLEKKRADEFAHQAMQNRLETEGLLEKQIEVISAQLEATNVHALEVEKSLQQSSLENKRLVEENEKLHTQIYQSKADFQLQLQESFAVAKESIMRELKNNILIFLESEIIPGIEEKSRKDASDAELRELLTQLTRQLWAQKLVEQDFLVSLETSQALVDSMRQKMNLLDAELHQLRRRLDSKTLFEMEDFKDEPTAANLVEMQIFNLKKELMEKNHQVQSYKKIVDEQNRRFEAELRVFASNKASLEQTVQDLRQRTTDESTKMSSDFANTVHQLKLNHRKEVESLRIDFESQLKTAKYELEQERNKVKELEDVFTSAHQEENTSDKRKKPPEQPAMSLQQRIQELNEKIEVKDAVIKELEKCIAEMSATKARGKKGEATDAPAVIARKLVATKSALADSQRRLRIMVKDEMDLRATIRMRDERIKELKELMSRGVLHHNGPGELGLAETAPSAEVDKLKARIRSLETQILQKNTEKITSRDADSINALKEMEELIKSYQERLQSALAEVQDHKVRIHKDSLNIQQLQASNHNLERHNQKLEGRVKELESQTSNILKIENDFKSTQKALEEMQRQRDLAREEAKAHMVSSAIKIQQLQGTISVLQKHGDSTVALKEKVVQMSKELQDLKANESLLSRQLQDARDAQSKAESRLAGLQGADSKLEQCRQDNLKCNQQLAEVEAERFRLAETMESMTRMTSELTDELRHLKDREARIMIEMDAARASMSALTRRNLMLESENSKLISRLTNLKQDDIAQSQVSETGIGFQVSNEFDQESKKGHRDAVEEVKKDLESQRQFIDRLVGLMKVNVSHDADHPAKDKEIRQLKGELAAMRQRMSQQSTYSREFIKIAGALDEITLEIQDILGQLHEEKSTNIRLSSELSESRNHLRNAMLELEKAGDEIERIRRESYRRIREVELDIEAVKGSWHSPEEWNLMSQKVRELKGELKQVHESSFQAHRRFEEIMAEKDGQLEVMDDLKGDASQLRERVKHLTRENTRKDVIIKDTKERIENLRSLEGKFATEKQKLEERIKSHLRDIDRKDQLAKQYKKTIDELKAEIQEYHNDMKEKEKQSGAIKKLKTDVALKESQIQTLQQRTSDLEKMLAESEAEKTQMIVYDSGAMVEKEKKLQSQITRHRNECDSFKEILRSVGHAVLVNCTDHFQAFRELWTSLRMNIKDFDFVGQSFGPDRLSELVKRIASNERDHSVVVRWFEEILSLDSKGVRRLLESLATRMKELNRVDVIQREEIENLSNSILRYEDIVADIRRQLIADQAESEATVSRYKATVSQLEAELAKQHTLYASTSLF